MARGVQIVNTYVVDTHALFWYLTASPRLSARAKDAFDEGKRGEARVCIPAIVLAELFYLNEKLGRQLDFAVELRRLRAGSQFELIPFLADDTLDFEADRAVPEMHDRMIAGVARRLHVPLITNDPQIAGSNLVTTIW
jgi:PIN domain nuclease of toxin-antitoxin system